MLTCPDCNSECIPEPQGKVKKEKATCSECKSELEIHVSAYDENKFFVLSTAASVDEAAASAYWRSGHASEEFLSKMGRFRAGNYPNSPFKNAVEEFGEFTPRDPSKVYCGSCGRETSYIESVISTHPVFTRVQVQVGSNPVVWEQKTKVTASGVRLCPACIDHATPILDREGNYVSHGLKYPPSI